MKVVIDCVLSRCIVMMSNASLLSVAGCLFPRHCWPAWPREGSWNRQTKVTIHGTRKTPGSHIFYVLIFVFVSRNKSFVLLFIQRQMRRLLLKITMTTTWIMKRREWKVFPRTGIKCLTRLGTYAVLPTDYTDVSTLFWIWHVWFKEVTMDLCVFVLR